MKKLKHFATNVRANAILCAGLAVLLTACGGGNVDGGLGQNTQLAATAVDSAQPQAAGAPAAAAPDAAALPAEQAQVPDANVAGGAAPAVAPGYPGGNGAGTGQAAAAKANPFEMSGYGQPADSTAAGSAEGTSGTQGATASASPDLRAAAAASPAAPLSPDIDPVPPEAGSTMF
ncbi:hypothetical protein NX773_15765 [Massilia solisilvae]|uniref:Lipoprotein n=1 Tax=Massilia solisilvae TaxID=1811225 RepID=A0ABT2BM83_9BURK|nr:hypothetical protein [Massilia solisilvae]MCS0609625.1 hypothetical protein [Massilia solisilvae]